MNREVFGSERTSVEPTKITAIQTSAGSQYLKNLREFTFDFVVKSIKLAGPASERTSSLAKALARQAAAATVVQIFR